MRTAKVIALSYTYLFLILLGMTLFSMSLPHIFGQQATTIQGPNVGNLEFKEQEAYIVTELPEGVLAQNSNVGTGNELTNMIIAAAGSSGVIGILNGIYTRITGKKNEEKTEAVEQKTVEVKKTTQELATNQTKIVGVQEEGLKLQYDTMGVDKANAIVNRPEIKLTNVEKLKEQTMKTTANA